jgi:hypothetical protein
MGCSEDKVPEDDSEAEEVEVVVKMEAGCERKKNGLVAEVLAALLASDLGLPVPEPFLVRLERDFAETIPDEGSKALAMQSLGWAFGSKKLPPQYAIFEPQLSLSEDGIPEAAEILAFDVLICNADRRVGKPNCLGNGRRLAIIDHELAFLTEGVIGWKPPWEPGGVYFAPGEHQHLFYRAVKGKMVDFQRLSDGFERMAQDRFEEYRTALPVEWQGTDVTTSGMVTYLQEMRARCADAFKHIALALR